MRNAFNPNFPFGRDEALDQAVIQRRKRQEEERKKRFFDDKKRVIGVDTQALQNQMKEKEAKERKDEMQHEQYVKYLAQTDRLLEQIEAQKQAIVAERIEKDFELNEFMKNNPHLRREYYLNDPLLLKKEKPPRLGDNDKNCSPSGLQKFEGEDLNRHKRQEQQRHEMYSIIDQQLSQKEKQRQLNQDRARMEAEYLRQLDRKLEQLENQKKQLHKQMDDNQARFNNDQAKKGRPKLVVDKFLPTEDFFSQFNTSSR